MLSIKRSRRIPKRAFVQASVRTRITVSSAGIVYARLLEEDSRRIGNRFIRPEVEVFEALMSEHRNIRIFPEVFQLLTTSRFIDEHLTRPFQTIVLDLAGFPAEIATLAAQSRNPEETIRRLEKLLQTSDLQKRHLELQTKVPKELLDKSPIWDFEQDPRRPRPADFTLPPRTPRVRTLGNLS